MQKGGIKLRRSGKHKGSYAAQVFRTERNKAAARTRIARRKADNPQPAGAKHRGRRARRLNRAQPKVLSTEQAYQRLLDHKTDEPIKG